jgi:hypothetical protein
VPITGTTLAEAARNFCEQLNHVLSRTLTQTRAVPFEVSGVPLFQVAFRQGGVPVNAQLHTRYGQIGLFLGQVCGSVVREGNIHQLFTRSYRYRLYSHNVEEPIIRWEYERETGPDAQWCRHHLQGPIEVRFNRTVVSLNDIHLPTGYVTFEEVIRFCIADLGVTPLHDEWDRILRESYAQFKGGLGE